MKFNVKSKIVKDLLALNKGIEFDLDEVGAIEQIQRAVDWLIEMPKTKYLRKSSPSAYSVKHRIENFPAGSSGYVSREAAIIAAIILGFPVCKNYDRIGIDEDFCKKWLKVRTVRPDTVWTFFNWEK
jgi:hypothetical protein